MILLKTKRLTTLTLKDKVTGKITNIISIDN